MTPGGCRVTAASEAQPRGCWHLPLRRWWPPLLVPVPLRHPRLSLFRRPLVWPWALERRDPPWSGGIRGVGCLGSTGARQLRGTAEFGHSRVEEQVVQPWGQTDRQTDGAGWGEVASRVLPPPTPWTPALTREGVTVPGHPVQGQDRGGGGHQHPHHRRPHHRRVGLEGGLSWKRAAAVSPQVPCPDPGGVRASRSLWNLLTAANARPLGSTSVVSKCHQSPLQPPRDSVSCPPPTSPGVCPSEGCPAVRWLTAKTRKA